jgi:hypothetical protein
MRFTEVNLLGVYVAPINVLMVVAWIGALGLRWVAARWGLLYYVWHPALFLLAVYLIVLSLITLTTAHLVLP